MPVCGQCVNHSAWSRLRVSATSKSNQSMFKGSHLAGEDFDKMYFLEL